MQKVSQEIAPIIISVVVLLIIIGVIVLLLTVYYDNTRKRLLKEKEILKTTFEQTLLQTRIEIQEQTLTNISRELHDNITQVLSFIKLNLAITPKDTAGQIELKISESRNLIAQVINDLRDLSKSLSYDHIIQLGLVKTLEIEADRINKSGILNIQLAIGGDARNIGEQRELVLFRIFQEALNNTLKHSKANQLKISLDYFDHLFNLTIQDNGVGFFAGELPDGGSGLKNIVNRAALIGAVAVIDSAPGKGCCIKIAIDPLTQQINANANYNSTG